MWLKNFLTWKKKSKVLIANKSKLYIKKCCLIVQSVEKYGKCKSKNSED